VVSHKKIKILDGERWTVMAETAGDGVGLPRGTKIFVKIKANKLYLTALGGDWVDETVTLKPVKSPCKPKAGLNGSGKCDPEWNWEGKLKRIDDDEEHTIKVGLVDNDPGIISLFVNKNGMATIRR
jgi:hypothetical protein